MSNAEAGQPAVTLRSLGLPVYLPTLLFAIGQGAVVPIVALAARDLGASVALAGFIAALRGIGILAFDVPAGWLVQRFGDRRAMTAGTALVAVSLVGSAWGHSPLVFGAFTFLMGCGWSVWLLARLTYVTEVMPIEMRGRALSTLGGVNRIGNFIGPFIAVVAIKLMGLEGAYLVHFITALAALLMLVLLVKDALPAGASAAPASPGHGNVVHIVRNNAGVFFTAGLGVTAIQVLRATRQLVLPLWAEHIGLGASDVSVVFGISVGMEMLLFYPAGSAMDRLGRKWVALPCLAIMSLGMLIIPLTHEFWTLTLVGVLVGFGNGLGSGIVMTLGADFSPAAGRAQFLGAWRLVGDIGTAGGPLIVAGATAALGLAPASVLMGAIGIGGAALIFLRMPEPLRMYRRPAPE